MILKAHHLINHIPFPIINNPTFFPFYIQVDLIST